MKKHCNKCNQTKDENEFHIRNDTKRKNHRSWCKTCHSLYSLNRQRERQKQIKLEFGGKCQLCGYNKCLDALEFHHRIPKTKKYELSNMWTYNIENIRKEAQKCDLICANCHREKHIF